LPQKNNTKCLKTGPKVCKLTKKYENMPKSKKTYQKVYKSLAALESRALAFPCRRPYFIF